MPELPEVEMITDVIARRSVGKVIVGTEIVRQNGKYLRDSAWSPIGSLIERVYRRGKLINFVLLNPSTEHGLGPFAPRRWMVCHNAMSGYWDYSDMPWTFDYVEGKRVSNDSDIRVKLELSTKVTLQFHDTRLFGSIRILKEGEAPKRMGPEPIRTVHNCGTEPMSFSHFREGLLGSLRPVKSLLMDQRFIAGIGNIYASEACHLAGVDPAWPACSVPQDLVLYLFESLKLVLQLQIPKVNYDHLKVYRRTRCEGCGGKIHRELLEERATFSCPNCQWER